MPCLSWLAHKDCGTKNKNGIMKQNGIIKIIIVTIIITIKLTCNKWCYCEKKLEEITLHSNDLFSKSSLFISQFHCYILYSWFFHSVLLWLWTTSWGFFCFVSLSAFEHAVHLFMCLFSVLITLPHFLFGPCCCWLTWRSCRGVSTVQQRGDEGTYSIFTLKSPTSPSTHTSTTEKHSEKIQISDIKQKYRNRQWCQSL